MQLHSETPLTPSSTPSRSEVAIQDTWDLTALYPTPQDWEADFQKLQKTYPAITEWQGRLAEGVEAVHGALDLESQVDALVEKLNQYAALKSSEDSSNADSLAREARLDSALVRIAEAMSFLAPELQSLSDADFINLLEAESLSRWRNSLKKLRRLKPHTLSKNEERLLALGSAALRGHSETFSQLTNVDMKFGTVEDEDGSTREVTQSSLSSFLTRRDPRVRKAAFHSFYSEIGSHAYTLAASLANSVKADVFLARARHFPSALESSLFYDDVPVSVYDNLIASVRSRLPGLHKYFDLRRRALKLDEIHHYDTYVPIVADVKTHTPWDEAVNKVLTALEPLGAEYVGILREGLGNARWCDRYENKGKRSGAFSYGTYSGPPYILMNYKPDVFSDVYTLAHEAGHSMHTYYSRRAQSFQDYHYPIFLAEVASTFNEMLLTEHLLASTDDPAMRAYILNRQIDDLRGTLFRQTMFAEFEKLIHAAEESGEGLTLASFRSIYRGLLDPYFGPDFCIDEELEMEGLRIPHFYSAFYVYKYATGISAAAALASEVLRTGDTSKYIGFLSSGGSRFPIETLAEAGVDMLSSRPVDAALDLFERRVEELAALIT
ncbi:MAG: oligoendopeptidase F [Terrimicrobiaceae bacterium]